MFEQAILRFEPLSGAQQRTVHLSPAEKFVRSDMREAAAQFLSIKN